MQVSSTNNFGDMLDKLELTLDEKYGLYRETVYHPDKDNVIQLNNLFRALKGRDARVLREDFCGIFDLSTLWVDYNNTNKAICVDVDSEPIEWGKNHTTVKMNSNKWNRVDIRNDDCRYVDVKDTSVDISIVGNWSQQILVKRSDMLAYFKNVYDSLKDDGIFMLGGVNDLEYEIEPYIEHRAIPFNNKSYKYTFEIQGTCPYTHLGMCKIHFALDNKNATPFVYPWRVWTVAEYLDILSEVGFEKANIMAQIVDEDDLCEGFYKGDGFYPIEVMETGDDNPFDPIVVAEKRV